AVQMGTSGAARWIVDAVGPVQTIQQRQQALTALGYADLKAFQKATKGLTADGKWGGHTHAAMIAALRNAGSASLIPIPSRDQMLDAMVRHSASASWGKRVKTLRNASAFTDTEFQL